MSKGNQKTKAWDHLEAGDAIAVVYPSHRPEYKGTTPEKEIAHVKGWVASLGLTLFEPDALSQFLLTERDWEIKAGGAKKRAEQIIKALENPKVKAIYAYGGHGGDEVILELEKYFKAHGLPKREGALPLIGFSDATQLQLYLGEMGIVSPIQVACKEDTDTLEVKKLLLDQVLPQQTALIPINDAAKKSPKISGKAIGGNDVAVRLAHRTNHRLQTADNRNNILLLEGITTYNFYKTLEILEKQGQLANVKAIVLGKCYGNKGDETLEKCNLEAVVKELKNLKTMENIPIFFGAPFGHPNGVRPVGFSPIPLNTETTIETTGSKSSISFSPVRTMEDVNIAKQEYTSRIAWIPTTNRDNGNNEIKDGNDAIQTTSIMHIPVELNQLRQFSSVKIPTNFIGCSIAGTDIPAFERENLKGKNLLINIDLGGETDLNKIGGFWSLAQKSTIPLMQLKHMHQDKNLGSITISAPMPFPEKITEYLKEFTGEHFPGKPVFTALLLHTEEIVRKLNNSSIPHLGANPVPCPLLVTLNTYLKGRDQNPPNVATKTKKIEEPEQKTSADEAIQKELTSWVDKNPNRGCHTGVMTRHNIREV